MRQRSDEAYVLRTQDLGEADRIVTLLAETRGRVRGVASSARKSRRRFGGALEPLTRVRARWSEKDGRELHRIEALEPVRSFASMQSDPALQAACAVLSEIAGATGREGEGDPREFRLLGAVLEALEGGLHPWFGVRYFEYWTLRLHGLLPRMSSCACCGIELCEPQAGRALAPEGIRCGACARAASRLGRPVTSADRRFLEALAALPPSGVAGPTAPALPGGAVDELLRGTLEAFAERRFRTYRHLVALTVNEPASGGGR